MNILKPLSFTYNLLMDFIFPPRCVICNDIYSKKSFKDSIYICDACIRKIRFVEKFSSQCKKCSRPINNDKIICNVCHITKHKYDIAVSCAIYEKGIRSSLLSYKFSEQRYKYRTYASLMLNKYEKELKSIDFDCIVSVPISKTRKKQRGFDHIEPLAKFISLYSGIKYIKDAVFKIKDTPPQSKLSFHDRYRSVKGAYRANDEVDFKGKSVLLIDDIYTTGATVDEISGILKRKGAKFVAVLTLCITPNVER